MLTGIVERVKYSTLCINWLLRKFWYVDMQIVLNMQFLKYLTVLSDTMSSNLAVMSLYVFVFRKKERNTLDARP